MTRPPCPCSSAHLEGKSLVFTGLHSGQGSCEHGTRWTLPWSQDLQRILNSCSLLCSIPAQGPLGGDAGLGRTLLSAPLQGKGLHAAQAWAKLMTCELATSSTTQAWPKSAQGTIPPPVPLELVHGTLPYGKRTKTSMFQSHARGPLDVGPASRDRGVGISTPLDPHLGRHAQLDPGDSATSPEEVSWLWPC